MQDIVKRKLGSSETKRGTLNKNFLDWLIGFIEGDGTFFIRSNNTLGFEISQSTQDAQILYYIKKELGFGKVYHNSKTNVSRYVVQSLNHIGVGIIPILNGSLQLIKRQTQFDAFQLKYHELMVNTTPSLPDNGKDSVCKLLDVSLDNARLSGFIDAEGCFRINYDKTNDRYQLIFQITQDEKEILDKIKEIFKTTFKGQVRKDRNTFVLAFNGEKSRNLLNTYLRRYPLKTKKLISWQKWLKAERILLKYEGAKRVSLISSKDKEKLERLRKSINRADSPLESSR